MKTMIRDECSLLHAAQLASHNKHIASSSLSNSDASNTLSCTNLVGSLSEDSVLQIMSTAAKDAQTAATLKDSSAMGAFSLPILLTDKRKSDSFSEENVSDIDLSFLNEADGIISDPKHLSENVVKELQGMIESSPPLTLNFLGTQVEQPEAESTKNNDGGDTVMIDISQPIQLSQNSLIVVNGQKCILQHDLQTGQVVAYPIKENGRPRRRRGRPRKASVEQVFVSAEKNPPQETENLSEEEREKGLLEVVNDDGSLVRRSSRKRKKAKTLKDYETGNLQQELGSDVEEAVDDEQPFNRRRRPRGPGRPRKLTPENMSERAKESDLRPARGREEEEEASQAFLVQTADGQTLMLQVPLSSIPPGTTLQQMAQEIANKLNVGLGQEKSPSNVSAGVGKTEACVENEPALQDHSIGSTTSFLQQQPQQLGNCDQVLVREGEICESQEIILECDQSLNDVTSGENLMEENNLNAPESLEDNFCLDVSSTTHNTSVDAPLLCPFNDHLIDHSFYVMRPKSVPEVEGGQKNLFQGSEAETTVVPGDPLLDRKLPSPDPRDLLSAVAKNKDVNLMMGGSGNDVLEVKDSTQLPVAVDGSKSDEVLTVLLQESLSSENVALLPAEFPLGTKKCKICAVPYLTEEEIIEHFKARHPKCICLECNYMNEHPYSIKRHSYRHAGEECVCNICNKKYKDSYILKMHVKLVHLPPEVLFQCNVCQKEFNRKAHLKRHQRTHAPLRQHRCPLCDYQGCEKSDVSKHALIHEDPKFKCEVCGKAFRHLKNKELHVKRHSGQRDYKCAACNFYGYTYTDIRKHIERRHSTTCPLCKQVFSDPELCKEHKRLGLCQPSLLEAVKMEECPPPPTTLDDKKEIVLFGEVSLDI